MYFPYLYGRQAELNAIVDTVGVFGLPQVIFPIIEPVVENGKILSTLESFEATNSAAYIVVNPDQGDFVDSLVRDKMIASMASMLSNPDRVLPVFKENVTTTLPDIANFVASYPGRRIGVVLTTSRFTPPEISSTLGAADCVVFFYPSVNAIDYLTDLSPDRIVDISDNFRSEVRNKDYAGEEWFGNNHITWRAANRLGFSDFTVIPSMFRQGGGPVGAIAIHLSFEDGTNLRIQHFVSSTNEQTDPQATKFSEVLADINAQVILTPGRFRDSPGLAKYDNQRITGAYTNLSGNKRQQISHHIFTVAKSLGL